MKILKKIFIFIFVIFISSGFCLANEELEVQLGKDYLLTTDKLVISAFISDPTIVTLTPFFTIFNEKNIYMIHPQKVGKTNFTVFCKDGDFTFNITVKPEKPELKLKEISNKDFEILMLDIPPDFGKFNLNKTPKNKSEEGTK